MSASFLNLSFGQQNKKSKVFKVWVELLDSDVNYVGILLELKDSSVVVQNWNEEKVMEIPVQRIYRLKFRRTGAIGKGAAIGGIAGLVTGYLIGYSNGDDPEDYFFAMSAESKGAYSAFGIGMVGAAAGTVVGALKKKFSVRGSQQQYETVRTDLRKYLLVQAE